MNPFIIPLLFKLIDFAFIAAEARLDTVEVRGYIAFLQEKGEQVSQEDVDVLDKIIDGKLYELEALAKGDRT